MAALRSSAAAALQAPIAGTCRQSDGGSNRATPGLLCPASVKLNVVEHCQSSAVHVGRSLSSASHLSPSSISLGNRGMAVGRRNFQGMSAPYSVCPSLIGARHSEQQRLRPRASGSTDATSPAATSAPVGDQTKKPVTRRLILLRHAKSSWSDPSLMDHQRPLASRGRAAAKKIALRLAELGWLPGKIFCSDALRTQETLELMGDAVQAFREAEVQFLGSFYSVAAMDGQTARHLHETVVRMAGDAVTTVMCMGHNRGWEEAASEFAKQQIELKTAHGALLESRSPHADWSSAFASGDWELKHIVVPDPA